MYMRNLMSMDTEEMVRAQPMDAVVIIGGCDKTLPAQVMGAVSADKPAIVVPGHFKEGESMSAASVAFTRDYLKTYMAEASKASNSAALIKAMKEHYPTAGFEQALEIGAKVSKGEMKW